MVDAAINQATTGGRDAASGDRHATADRHDATLAARFAGTVRPAFLAALATLALILAAALTAPTARAAASGDLLWSRWLDGPAHALDIVTKVAEAPNGALYGAGVADDDWGDKADLLLIKQTPNAGADSWTLQWDGGHSRADRCADLVVDAKSNAVVVGTSESLLNHRDWILVKHSSKGSLLWETRWGGMGNDQAVAAVGDPAGNVYVCGTFENSPTTTDWKVVKFRAATGERVWTCTYSSPAAAHVGDAPTAIARDKAGNLYVAGRSIAKKGDDDAFVIKVSRSGSLLWKRRIDGPSRLYDEGVALAVAPSGGVYVAVESQSKVNKPVSRLLLVRLTASGRFAWATKWRAWRDPAVAGTTRIAGLKLDRTGNVYLAGSTWDTDTNDQRGFVQKRRADGKLWWARYYRPSGIVDSEFRDLDVSSAGRVWLTGNATTKGGSVDVLVARYETNGSRRWVRRFDSPDHLDDYGLSVTRCGSKALLVGGVVATASANDDALMLKYMR